jgi:AN1-type zinc finger protein 2
MELPHLGIKCAKEGCREENDYLPFTCTFCKLKFCKDHQKASPDSRIDKGHFCLQLPIDKRALICPLCNAIVPSIAGIDPDQLIDTHIRKGCRIEKATIYKNQCSLKGCKKKELVPIQCKVCLLTFCISHRLEQDHACLGPPHTTFLSRNGILPFENSRMIGNASSASKKDTCIIS